ncbi:MAG: homocysteine S-methyltransferase family protein [Eggerthellaceae bacterium]|nr:homocysteine S-methyltransferase family protein [Eggerthellaceae bacterium]
MPDIALRFHKDMLVLSSPASSALDRLGVDVVRDLELTTLLEPDTLEDIYKLEAMAGAQCFVANTASFTPARLAHSGFEDRASDLAKISLSVLRQFKPQHVLVEIGPCGLPLDPSSKASLVENRDQYSRAARLFEGMAFDAFFLNGFKNCDDLMCALIGIRKVSDALVFASVDVDEEGAFDGGRKTLLDAVSVMAEYGACVVGFSTAAGQEKACALTREVAHACDLPILVQLEVRARNARQQGPTTENPYYCADTMMSAADALHAAGAQFLRAVGDATPAYTGALMATVLGADVKIDL